ncbi:MAG: type II toxin-antitoxin system RelE/ParE family toxin [Cytophagales bacterium]|jgi:mRNA interferase RelE/StbE|nr:type II toxin-antitoxin system RelE/ParE family toxin [Cytophagales bacterium]MCE2894445.1 type II toxin-antitoxin system RelE/ParE family toxin [Flammeovirgaceae bacterium]MCA6366383.1 type II toxin-antitoxin system RelE/ParE family toxin [Cytophagales bacterium]MCA6371182.1 type II toxin-antitoxin system RelE/ParE family toxin [Cytophagales bacterium]MCA6374693.1 type II toxin-antitoxin system RelE/ParE family toxin [Cytophagales bacterium]
MRKYTVTLTKGAAKQLDKLSDAISTPILKSIESLAFNPRPLGCKKLKGREGFRIRIGDYRVIYTIFDKVLLVEVIDVGNRKDIYL